jgi:hypothetical protein
VAIIALAIAAPYIVGPAFLGLTGMTASIATAAIMAVGSIAISMGMRAIYSGRVIQSWGAPAKPQPDSTMRPVHMPWLFRLLIWYQCHWKRFTIFRTVGDCMPSIESTPWILIDRKATIRRGDLFAFCEKNWALSFYLKRAGIVKRFCGADLKRGTFDWQMDKPPELHCDPMSELEWAYRVRFAGRSYFSALCARFGILLDANAHDQRLAT